MQLSAATAQISCVESENAQLRDKYEELQKTVSAINAKLEAAETRTDQRTSKSSAADERKVASNSGSAHLSGRVQPSKKDSAAVEDSQDKPPKQRPGILKPKPVVEDSQEKGGQSRSRPASSDELSRASPLSYMPKDTQDVVALSSSSPLTDVALSLSPVGPVVDGGAMFPRSPSMSQGTLASAVAPGQSSGLPSYGASNPSESSGRINYWAYSKSRTSTETHSIVASKGQSPSINSNSTARGTSRPRPVAQHPSTKFPAEIPDSQGPPNMSARGSKRAHPAPRLGASSSERKPKRPRLGSETTKLGLGPTQASPERPQGSSRRKSSLRPSQRGKHCLQTPLATLTC